MMEQCILRSLQVMASLSAQRVKAKSSGINLSQNSTILLKRVRAEELWDQL